MAQKFSQATRIFSHATPSMMDIWIEQKAKLKKKFPSLTDSDLRYKEGKKNEMFENLRIKLEISVEDWKKVMKEI
jgi:hypothetical protein